MARIGNKEVKVIKKHENLITGIRVEMTRKTTIAGAIIYAVVITNMFTGWHYKILTFPGMGAALKQYKEAIA